jgi:hypothetical protein
MAASNKAIAGVKGVKEKEVNLMEVCGCGKRVEDVDNGLQCEICEFWFHTKCEKVSNETYKSIQDNESIHWFCKDCNKGAAKVLRMVSKLQERQEKLEEKFEEELGKVKSELAEIKEKSIVKLEQRQERIEKDNEDLKEEMVRTNKVYASMVLEQKESMKEQSEIQEEKWMDALRNIETKEPEVPEKLFSDIVKKHVDKTMETVTGDLIDMKKNLAEERDKESRRNNMIIYRVEESVAERAEARNADDQEYCKQLFKDVMGIDVRDDDMEKVFRLGRKGENKRPLMVQFGDRHVKNLIMESAQKLSQASEKYQGIGLSHDMTKSEREQCRELVSEAKQMAENDRSGEWIYRVRGLPGQMKVLKLKVRRY